MKVLKSFKTLVTYLEELPAPFIYFFLTFFFATSFRNFFEYLLFRENKFQEITQDFVHYYLFYSGLALGIILLFHFATRERISQIARVVLPGFLILGIAPLIDFLSGAARSQSMGYFFPVVGENIWLRFFTFFGPLSPVGVTTGMRFEIGLVLLASFFYFRIKACSWPRVVGFTFLMYTLIFVYCAIPYGVQLLVNLFGFVFESTPSVFIQFHLFLIFILGVGVFYRAQRTFFWEIVRDMRCTRLINLGLLFILGIVISERFYIESPHVIQFDQDKLFKIIFCFIAILFGWLFSVMTNNLADEKIDQVSSPERPTISGTIPLTVYRRLMWGFLLVALVYAFAVSFESLFFLLIFVGGYFIYSMPPVRFKRVPFFSKLLIAFNLLIIVIWGHTFHANDFRVPPLLSALFLIGLTPVINFIDLKDYAGDKAAGIKTLPTLLGMRKSQLLIGLFFAGAYVAAGWMFGQMTLVVPFAIAGGIQFYLITRQRYREQPVFVLYLVTVVFLIIYVQLSYGIR